LNSKSLELPRRSHVILSRFSTLEPSQNCAFKYTLHHFADPQSARRRHFHAAAHPRWSRPGVVKNGWRDVTHLFSRVAIVTDPVGSLTVTFNDPATGRTLLESSTRCNAAIDLQLCKSAKRLTLSLLKPAGRWRRSIS
jgi:hypothetical protein